MANDSYLFDCFSKLNLKSNESFSFIFYDNIGYLKSLNSIGKLRDVAYDNCLHTILCGSVYLGFDYYECPSCHKETIIPHSCSSRLCSKCGVKDSKERSILVSNMVLPSNHRHLVFTIPASLRRFFAKDRALLEILFIAARNTIMNLFNKQLFDSFKRKKRFLNHKSEYLFKDIRNPIIPASVASLHTFGRDLKFNPHIHMLLCEDAYDSKKDCIKNFSYMHYDKLRKTWMYEVLSLLQQRLGNRIYDLKNELYTVCPDGFYVYARKPKKEMDEEDVESCVSYITRYTSRPAMAESRIINYNPDTKIIHWYYDDHKTEERVEVKEHVHQFLNKLLMHCPEKNFKMVRYYGLYSNKSRKHLNRMYELTGKHSKKEIQLWEQRQAMIKTKKQRLKFRFHMIQSLNIDPLLCSCGNFMTFYYTYIPMKGGGLHGRRYQEKSIREMDEWGGFKRRRDPNLIR